MSDEIVKVQVPIFPKGAPALIYPQEDAQGARGIRVTGRITHQKIDKITRAALKDDLKGYFMASFKDGKWKLGRRVRPQDW